jgi:thiamine-phosphate diphosphorylase
VSQLALPGSTLAFGLSTHAPAQAERALAAEPAYVAIGPIYATGTKPTARPVTLDYVRWAAGQVRLPWFAIGGINLQNLDEVLAAGARRICVLPDHEIDERPALWLVYPKSNVLTAKVRVFIDFLMEKIAAAPPWAAP